MANVQENAKSFPIGIGPIAASAKNAQKAEVWAEGTDEQVSELGGTHSAKGWAEQAQSIVSSLGTVLHYKGSVANYAALQAVTGQIVGDVYNVTDTGDNYFWDGSAWDQLSGTVDLSAYRTAAAQDVIDAGKQPLLPAGTTGNYLQKTADGVQWNSVDALPSQTGQSGKFLTTDGTTASWDTIQAGGAPTLTWYTGNTGTTVTIADTTGASLVKIYKNGILLQPTADYSISGTTLTLVTALVATDKITTEIF